MSESIGLFDIDMSEIKKNSKKQSKILAWMIKTLGKRNRLPNGRYKK